MLAALAIANLAFAADVGAAQAPSNTASDGRPLPDPMALIHQEHDKFVALYPGFVDYTTRARYSDKQIKSVLDSHITATDPTAKLRLQRSKTGSYGVKLWQTNARVNVVAADLQDPNDPYGRTFVSETVSFDDDMFSNKTVRLTPMLLRRAPGRYRMVQWGRSVSLKKWDDFRLSNLVKSFMGDKEIVEPLHVSIGKVRPKKLTAKQRAEGDLYIAVNQSCISRYSGNVTCKKLLSTAYRASGGRANRGKALTYGRAGYPFGSVINVVSDSRNGRLTYRKSMPVHSFYFEPDPKRAGR